MDCVEPFFEASVDFDNFLYDDLQNLIHDDSVFNTAPFPTPSNNHQPMWLAEPPLLTAPKEQPQRQLQQDQHIPRPTSSTLYPLFYEVKTLPIKSEPIQTKSLIERPPMITTKPVIFHQNENSKSNSLKYRSKITSAEIKDQKAKTNRKRKKSSDIPKEMRERESAVLTREELLSFSSEQFEEFVEQISEVRELTPSENNELKRQRRLIKNRESAQASRQRKKSHIDELERRVKDLAGENRGLKDNIESLSTQNSELKNEIAFLQSMVKSLQNGNTKSNQF